MADGYHRKMNDSQAAVEFLAREVERLSRELAAANDSRHVTELLAVEWKTSYETARLEVKELEQELSSTRARVSEAEAMERDVTEDRTSSDAAAEALRDEIAALKNIVNQHKLDKAELESIILSQRYSEHPGNVARLPARDTLSRGNDCSSTARFITFRVSRRRRKMYCGHARLCVCLSVCLSVRSRMPTLWHGTRCNLGEW